MEKRLRSLTIINQSKRQRKNVPIVQPHSLLPGDEAQQRIPKTICFAMHAASSKYRSLFSISTHPFSFKSEKTAKRNRMLVTNEDGSTKVIRKRDAREYSCSSCHRKDSSRWRCINKVIKCKHLTLYSLVTNLFF